MTGRLIPRPLAAATLLIAVLAAGCGEPPLAIELPTRADGQQVADLGGAIDDPAAIAALLDEHAADGVDIVVLTYETDVASCGEAFRAGRAFVDAWDADAAMIAVAEPGGFDDPLAERCAGIQPRDDFAVGRGVREEITEVLWPPMFEAGDFDQMFRVGADALAEALSGGDDDA